MTDAYQLTSKTSKEFGIGKWDGKNVVIGTTKSGKKIFDAHDPVYDEIVRHGLYHDVSHARKMTRSTFPKFTKKDHMEASNFHMKVANKASKSWNKVINPAWMERFGRKYEATDYRVSGVADDRLPENIKNKLRLLAFLETSSTFAAKAHDIASKYIRKKESVTKGLETTDAVIRDVQKMADYELKVKLTYEQAAAVAKEILKGAKERDDLYHVPTARLRKIVDKIKKNAPGSRNKGSLYDIYEERLGYEERLDKKHEKYIAKLLKELPKNVIDNAEAEKKKIYDKVYIIELEKELKEGNARRFAENSAKMKANSESHLAYDKILVNADEKRKR